MDIQSEVQTVENWLAKVGSGIANEEKKVVTFLTDAKKVEVVFSTIIPEAKPVVAAILKDLMQAVANGSAAVAAKGLNFSLDTATVESLVKLVDDARADVPEVKQWLTSLGVTV